MADEAKKSHPHLVRHSYVRQQYPAWVERTRLRPGNMTRLRYEVSSFEHRPRISVLLPVYDPKKEWLERALDSVLGQVYPYWELCVVDDGSESEHVSKVLSFYGRLDGRIKVRRQINSGISAASNAGLSMSTGEYVALLDHDDELSPDALFEVAKLLQKHPEADLVYSDVDKINESGQRSGPNFKPGWSPHLLLSSNYIGHLGVYRKKIVEEIGGFRSGFDGCQDYDLVLRFTEKTNEVHHVPKVLYHWRTVEGSVALSPANKSYIRERAHRALSEALQRRGMEGIVEDGLLPNRFRIKLAVQDEPKVSLLILARDGGPLLRNCIESVRRLTSYENYEILIAGSKDPATVGDLASVPHRFISHEGDLNSSRFNNMAGRGARGEYLLFLDGATEVISDHWLQEMLGLAQDEKVGAVGAQLLYADGRILHAGILVGVGNPWAPPVATYSHQYHPPGSPGYVGAAKVIRNYSAVAASCMLVRRELFEKIGGFDETLQGAWNGVDLCLRMRERGYLIVYTPHVRLYHHGPDDQGFNRFGEGAVYMRERWGEKLDNDPYYNPNFSLGTDFNLRADLLRPKVIWAEDDRSGGRENIRSSRLHSLAPRLTYKEPKRSDQR